MLKLSRRMLQSMALIIALIMFCFFVTACNNQNVNKIDATPIPLISSQYQIPEIAKEFDYFDYDEENLRVSAYLYDNKEKLSNRVDTTLIDSDTVRFAYEVVMVAEESLLYITMSVFDENENLVDVVTSTAVPIYYEDNTYDAIFTIEGKQLYLSEILQGDSEDCFFLTALFGSILIAKIIAAIVVVAKVVIVVAAVVVVGAVTYSLVKVTSDWINEKEREKEEQKKKPIPLIYYYARSSGDKLIIASVSESLSTASSKMRASNSYWTPFAGDALTLAITASGSSVGPEIDRDYRGQAMKGRYWHYHCGGRANGGAHSWYGTPYGGVY